MFSDTTLEKMVKCDCVNPDLDWHKSLLDKLDHFKTILLEPVIYSLHFLISENSPVKAESTSFC